MNTVKVRNIEIGSGVPKICVPIVGVTKDEIIAEAKTFDSIPVDVVEWRVDWFEGVFEFDKVEDVLKLGDVIDVKVTEIDNKGRINVSAKALLPKPKTEEEKNGSVKVRNS